LYLDTQGIEKLVKQYESDTKAIKDELLRICWFMRGSVSYFDSLMLDVEEREIIGKIISDNLETTKESGMPFF
jgi:ABC-type antimicrobial peptide transport system permease subunit